MNNKEYLEKYEKLFNEINCDHSEYSNISYDDINIANYRGIYAISIDDPKSFEEFVVMAEHQIIRNHINDYPMRKNLIYIGETSDSISQRLFKDELGGCYFNGKEKKSHRATFYRKLGSVLGFKSYNPGGEQLTESQKRNFVFSLPDNSMIRDWIIKHLKIKYFNVNQGVTDLQNRLIREFRPTFNGTHNKPKCRTITDLHTLNKQRKR